MNRAIRRAVMVFSVVTSAASAAEATELQTYVQQCQTELHFNASDVPALSCNDGIFFATEPSSLVNDYMVYKWVNDTVDLTAACRWLDGSPPNVQHVASVELIIHNRQNGSTCFFSAADGNTGDTSHPVMAAIVSPTNFPAADGYWLSPTALNNKQLPNQPFGSTTDFVRCVGCHSGGPYIASPRIAPTLARFGLLNNRHDTFANMTASNHFHAVGSNAYNDPNSGTNAFKAWDSIIYNNTHNPSHTCSGACHAIADHSTTSTLFLRSDLVFTLLPSISSDISQILSSDPSPMPPFDNQSDYRWINLDTAGDGVESESYLGALNATNTLVPHLFTDDYNCSPGSVPIGLQAHAVGVDPANSFVTGSLYFMGGQAMFGQTGEYFRYFNLKDGLVCMDADQDPGVTCHDYDVSYQCANGAWTPFFNHTVNSAGGDDHEERSTVSALITGACGSAPPVAIQARTWISVRGGTVPVTFFGPNDRLARFSPYGLTCNNADQPDAKCSNYVVDYNLCTNPPAATTYRLTSVWSGKVLAATSNVNNTAVKGLTLNTGSTMQQWVMEPVANTEYVRLRNVGTNTYLNVTSQAEASTVVSSTSSSSTSQQWVVEFVWGAPEYRLRNLWAGRYLTINNTNNNAPILSQAKNATWASQRWTVQ